MGWSWAPYLAETCLEAVFRWIFGEAADAGRLVDRGIPAPLGPSWGEGVAEFLSWLYMDDFLVATLEFPGLPWDETKGSTLQDRVRAGFKHWGFPLHKEEEGEGVRESIGISVSKGPHHLRPLAEKLLHLMLATTWACCVPLVQAEEIRRIVGRWTWTCLTLRLSYSIFSSVYAFIERNLKMGPILLWDTARAELATMVSIAPLLGMNLEAPLSSSVYQTDASPGGFGIVRGTFPLSEIWKEVRGAQHPALTCHLDRVMADLEDEERAGWHRTKEENQEIRRHLAEPRKGRGFLELFGEPGGLTSEAVRVASWAEAWGLKVSPKKNLLEARSFEKLERRVKKGTFWMVHVSPPAATWSLARHPPLRDRRNIKGLRGLSPSQQRAVEEGTLLTLRAIQVAWAAIEAGVGFALEFPARCLVWCFGPMKELLRHPKARAFQADMCAYGGASRKRTRIVTNVPALLPMARRCSCANGHTGTRGRIDGVAATRVTAGRSPDFRREYFRRLAQAIEGGLLQLGGRAGELGRPPKPAFQECGLPWRSVSQWETVFRGEWAREEPITVQEVRTLGLLSRHLSRAQGSWGSRFLVLMDSMGSIGCHEKGRSGSFPMLLQCRRLAAAALALGIRFILRWVPTHWNFADGPSRGGPCGVDKSSAGREEVAPWAVDMVAP